MSLLSIDISWQVTAIVCVLIIAISFLLCVHMYLSAKKTNNNIVDVLGHSKGNDSMESKIKNDACSTSINTMLCKIFISYKRKDKNRVLNLQKYIELNTNVLCWLDLSIECDANFDNVIMNRINECEIFLFMYSKEHLKINNNYGNDWTIRELNFAKKKEKRIIFINMDNAALCDWLLFMFPNKQEVDASSEDALKRLCDDIQKWVTKIR